MIDWNDDIEAVHENGKVERVYLEDERPQPDEDGDYTLVIGSLDGYDVYRTDGSSWSDGPWHIRNVA